MIAWRFTERAAAQNELILNSVGEGIFGLNREGQIIFANPVAGEILGLEVENLIGQPIVDFLDREPRMETGDSTGARAILSVLNDGALRNEGREPLWRADGTQFPAEFSNAIMERGERAGAVVSIRDVTRRERAAEELRQSQKQYQDLINSIDGMVWEAEAETFRFTFVSEQAEQILGYPRAAGPRSPTSGRNTFIPRTANGPPASAPRRREKKNRTGSNTGCSRPTGESYGSAIS
jgi:PAS domain S-box-containing protein